jgi:hypothetical protein
MSILRWTRAKETAKEEKRSKVMQTLFPRMANENNLSA